MIISVIQKHHYLRTLVHNVTTSSANLITLPRNGRQHTGELPKMFGKINVLAGFGNPLLDITVKIDDDKLLKKYKLNSDDQKEIPVQEMNKLLQDVSQYKGYVLHLQHNVFVLFLDIKLSTMRVVALKTHCEYCSGL